MVRAREGASAAREKPKAIKKGLTPKLPLELAQIDHTLADIVIVD